MSSPVQNSLLNASDKRGVIAKTFMKEQFLKLEGHEKPQKSLYSPLPKANVKIMADIQKQYKSRPKVHSHKKGANSSIKVSLERVFSFENTPVQCTNCMCQIWFMHNLESMY